MPCLLEMHPLWTAGCLTSGVAHNFNENKQVDTDCIGLQRFLKFKLLPQLK